MRFTTIRVSEPIADELHDRKQRGESYDDVLRRLLGMDTDTDDEPADAVDTDALRDALPGSAADLDGRVTAVLTMYDYLRANETAEKRELLAVVDVDATGYDSEASFWSNAVKGRDTLRALPGVEPPPSGRTEWRYSQP